MCLILLSFHCQTLVTCLDRSLWGLCRRCQTVTNSPSTQRWSLCSKASNTRRRSTAGASEIPTTLNTESASDGVSCLGWRSRSPRSRVTLCRAPSGGWRPSGSSTDSAGRGRGEPGRGGNASTWVIMK